MVRAVLIDPSLLRIVLLTIGFSLLLLAWLLHAVKKRRRNRASIEAAHLAQYYPPERRRSSWLLEVLRVGLLFIALVVAVSLVLVLIPDQGMNRVADYLQSGRAAAIESTYMLGFLYLGDETRGSEFHVRGVVRNISSTPIEQLDVLVRLYGVDGRLLETTVVRTDSERLLPDEIAQFHLTYPNYRGQFGSYSVDFKLRQGDQVPYKDMRTGRNRS